jgi:hypothetical protein
MLPAAGFEAVLMILMHPSQFIATHSIDKLGSDVLVKRLAERGQVQGLPPALASSDVDTGALPVLLPVGRVASRTRPAPHSALTGASLIEMDVSTPRMTRRVHEERGPRS